MNVIVRITGNHFDSKIEIPHAESIGNCIIYLELRLRLVQFNGKSFVHTVDKQRETYRTQPWTPDEWSAFCYKYKFICEHWWSHQFWLRPSPSFNEMNLPLSNPTHRPNFQCKLRFDLLRTDAERRHARITVVRLADDERDMRSDSRTYDNRDMQEWYPEGYPHITVYHEVGHLLGLGHPGIRKSVPACKRDGNADVCYKPYNELMGAGLGMIPEYAHPWVDRLAQHTHTREADWTVFRHDIAPVSLSHERLMRHVIDGSQRRMRDRITQSVENL